MANYRNELTHTLSVFMALSDGNRLRTLLALQQGELCVCQIIELLGLAPSTISKHMSILKNAELVESTKKGRWVYYRISHCGNDAVQNMLQQLPDILVGNEQIEMDAVRLKRIVEVDPESLCKLQTERNDNEKVIDLNCCSNG